MEGIKISNCSGNFRSILAFDGKLCTFDGTLIDIDVADVDGLTYIKNNGWYHWSRDNAQVKSELIVEDEFLSCVYYLGKYFAITSDKIYHLDNQELTMRSLSNQVRMICSNGLIIILTEDGSLYRYHINSR